MNMKVIKKERLKNIEKKMNLDKLSKKYADG